MKQLILLISISILSTVAMSQGGVSISTTLSTPDGSSMLDVTSTNKGVLIPRVALTALNVAAPVTAPANSLLVYNTVTAGTGVNVVTPGFYHWDASIPAWSRIISGTSIGTDDQNIDSLTLVGSILTTYIENGNSASVDLASLIDTNGLYSFVRDSLLRDNFYLNNLSTTMVNILLANTSYLTRLTNLIKDSINTDNQNIDSLTFTADVLTVYIEDGNPASVNLSELNSDNQNIDSMKLVAGVLTTYIENGNSASVNLSGVNTDNQDIDSVTLNGGILTIYIEDGTSSSVDLSSLSDSVNLYQYIRDSLLGDTYYLDSLQAIFADSNEWTDQGDYILARRAGAAGDTVVVTDDGNILVGSTNNQIDGVGIGGRLLLQKGVSNRSALDISGTHTHIRHFMNDNSASQAMFQSLLPDSTYVIVNRFPVSGSNLLLKYDLKSAKIGIHTANPTNGLHISAQKISEDPIRIEDLKAGTSDSVMVVDGTGVVRFRAANTLGVSADSAEWTDQGDYILARRAGAAGDTVVVTDNGNIGIGTTTPSRDLTISPVTRDPIIRLDRNSPYSYEMYTRAGGIFHLAGRGDGTGGAYGGTSDLMDLMTIHHSGNMVINGYSSTILGASLELNDKGSGGTLGSMSLRSVSSSFSENSNTVDAGLHFKRGGAGSNSHNVPRANNNSTTTHNHIMTLSHTGNVGIDVLSPKERLHIYANNDSLQFEALAGTGNLLGIDANGKVFKTTGGGISTDSAEWTDQGDYILARRAGVTGDTVVVTDDGKMGIGTSSPDIDLNIKRDFNGTTGIKIENKNTSPLAVSSVTLNTDSGSAALYYGGSAHSQLTLRDRVSLFGLSNSEGVNIIANGNGTNSADIKFYTNGFSHGGYLQMIIDKKGYVGIDVGNPQERLHVDANNDSLQFENLAGTGNLLGIDANGKVYKTTGSSTSTFVTTAVAYPVASVVEVVFADATAGAFDVTLPDAALFSGRKISVKRTDNSANNVTVKSTAGNVETIAPATGYAMSNAYEKVTFMSDGTNWWIVSQ